MPQAETRGPVGECRRAKHRHNLTVPNRARKKDNMDQALSTTLTVVGVDRDAATYWVTPITLCYNDGEGNSYIDDAKLLTYNDGYMEIDWYVGCPQELAWCLESLEPDDVEAIAEMVREWEPLG